MKPQTDAPQLPGFSFIRDLGAGGFADVYLYQQEHPYRQVAIKVLRDATVSPRARDMFAAEANAMAQLEHPYIVRVYSTGITTDHRPYIVMSYYPNGSLAPRVRRTPLSVADTLKIGIEIGAAVETAHRASILHRDIKPANILLGPYDQPGLTDFGIAAQIAANDDDESGLSVPWAPPELLYSTGSASVQSDVYSLSATLWHLLVGRSPFALPGGDNSVFEVMKRVRDQPVPSTGRPEVPASLDRLLKQGMAKQVQQRPSSIYELVMSLQAIEQEVQLPRTQVMVTRAESPLRAHPGAVDDRTKAQPPQRIDPVAAVPAAAAWASPTAPDPWRSQDDFGVTRAGHLATPHESRTVRQREVVEPTQLRSATVVADEPQHRDGRKRWGAIIALVAALVLIAGIGATLMTRTGGKAASAPVASESVPPPQVGGDQLPPGVPVIKGQRSGDNVTFTWTYSAAEDSDGYRYRLGDGTIGNTTKRTITITSPPGSKACLEVWVYRTTGQASRDWSPQVCVP